MTKRILICMLVINILNILGMSAENVAGRRDNLCFTFDTVGKDTQLIKSNGEPIKPEEVEKVYGKEFVILCDGVDICSVEYSWKCGYGGSHPILRPKYVDLSNWEVEIEPGFVGIDPKLGRFKFSKGNNINRPILINRIQGGNLTPQDIKVRGKFAYLACDEETKGFQIIDLNDLNNPKYAGYLPLTGFNFGVSVYKNYAYVVDFRCSLRVIDITDPYKPRYIRDLVDAKFINPNPYGVQGGKIRMSNEYIYGVNSNKRVLIIDITQPDKPYPLMEVGENVGGFEVLNDYLLTFSLKDKECRIDVYKIEYRKKEANLVNSIVFESTRIIDSAISEDKKILFLRIPEKIKVIDISGLPNIKFISEFEIPTPGYQGATSGFEMVSEGNYLYITTGNYYDTVNKVNKNDLWIVDISNPNQLKKINSLSAKDEDIGSFMYLDVQDSIIYATSGWYGLSIYDAKDPTNIRKLGKISMIGEIENARVIGDKIFASGNGLYIIDFYPNPKESKIISFVWPHTYWFGKNVIGKIGSSYVIFQGPYDASAVKLIDISNPKTPRYIPEVKLKIKDKDIEGYIPINWGEWLGNYLYCALKNPYKGFIIFDMSNPINPQPIYLYETEEELRWITLRYNYAYVCGLDVVYIFDISNLKDIKLIGKCKLPYPTTGDMQSPHIYLKDNYLLLPGSTRNESEGARIVDVSDPTRPRFIGYLNHFDRKISVNSTSCLNSFYIKGKYLYVADYWTGLHIFDISKGIDKAKYIETIKDLDYPFSTQSYATSVDGYGKYIITTHFGVIDILEIPTEEEVPKGEIKVKWEGKK